MMLRVSRAQKRQRSHRDHIPARHPTPRPRHLRHVAEQRDGRQPHLPELVHVSRPSHAIRFRTRRGNVLVETLKRRRKAPAKPERAKGKRPLRVGYMIQRLPHAPLPRLIAMRRTLLRDPRAQFHRLAQLLHQRPHGVVGRNPVDVPPEIFRRFRFLRPSAHAPYFTPFLACRTIHATAFHCESS